MRGLFTRLVNVVLRRRNDDRLQEEIEEHLALQTAENIRAGLPAAEARRQAVLKFGSIEAIKEEYRAQQGLLFIESAAKDFAYAFRTLGRNPGFTAIAILTLALGIGLNTSLFAAFDSVALKPLPVSNPNQIVRLVRTVASGSLGDNQFDFSYPEYLYYRDQNRAFSSLIAATRPSKNFAMVENPAPDASEDSEGVQGQLVSANYFSGLGVEPLLGRAFLAREDAPAGAHPVIVLSYPFWRRHFDSDTAAVGQTRNINGTLFTIVGVMPRGFIGTGNPPIVPDFWAPLSMEASLFSGDAWLDQPTSRQVQLLARLSPGVGVRQAQAEITVLGHRFEERYPEHDRTVTISAAAASYFGEASDVRFRAFVTLLMVLVGLVLLIACANLANMLLARGVTRRKEIAVRLALGAGKSRLIRQLLVESVLLALLGGAAGLLLSFWGTRLLWISVAPIVRGFFGIDPSVIQMTPDIRVLVYTLLLSIATGIVFGLWPSVQSSKLDLSGSLKDDSASFGRLASHSGFRNALVVGQVGVSMLLLVSAGFLTRGLLNSQSADPEIETKTVFPLGLSFSSNRAAANALAKRVMDRLRTAPQVRSVGLAAWRPWTGTWTAPVQVEDTKAPASSLPSRVLSNAVSEGYFPALGIPIDRGRDFSQEEAETGAPVAIVSENAARQFWPDEDPLGKHLKLILYFGGNGKKSWSDFEVVGIAKDVRTANLSRIDPGYVYIPTDSSRLSEYSLLVRTVDPSDRTLSAIRAALEAVDGRRFRQDTPLISLADGPLRMQKIVPAAIADFAIALCTLALLLALIGIYGVVSYSISQRTREMGVRIALGASRGDIARLVLGQGMRPVLIGAGFGLLCALAAATFLKAILVFPGSPDLLAATGPLDPVVMIGLPVFLFAVSLLASYLPARRAMRVDPMVALRYE
jgi:macrolide transport system ATP-binding/permease protein